MLSRSRLLELEQVRLESSEQDTAGDSTNSGSGGPYRAFMREWLASEAAKQLNQKEQVTFLLAEQNTNMALRYCHYGYILENGRVVMDGDAKTLLDNQDVKEFYLGVSGGERKSFRNVKHYRRRKRWLS